MSWTGPIEKEAGTAQSSTSGPSEGEPISQKPLILIAEDDRRLRELLEAILQRDYRLVMAKDGLQAIVFAKKCAPDLILMDIQMPKLTGWQVIREIRALRKKVPIIVITGFHDPYNKLKARRLEIADCLAKPLDLVRLQRLIEERISSTE